MLSGRAAVGAVGDMCIRTPCKLSPATVCAKGSSPPSHRSITTNWTDREPGKLSHALALSHSQQDAGTGTPTTGQFAT